MGRPLRLQSPDALRRTLDKAACYAALGAAGYPVPAHRSVTRCRLGRPTATACSPNLPGSPGPRPHAGRGGPPPGRQAAGRGLVVRGRRGPPEPDALAAAVDAAFATTAGAVLVEEFLTGTEFSVVVLDGPDGCPPPWPPPRSRSRRPASSTAPRRSTCTAPGSSTTPRCGWTTGPCTGSAAGPPTPSAAWACATWRASTASAPTTARWS